MRQTALSHANFPSSVHHERYAPGQPIRIADTFGAPRIPLENDNSSLSLLRCLTIRCLHTPLSSVRLQLKERYRRFLPQSNLNGINVTFNDPKGALDTIKLIWDIGARNIILTEDSVS